MRVTMCANRGLISMNRDGQSLTPRLSGPNGLIPVVLPALRESGGTWVSVSSVLENEASMLPSPEIVDLVGQNIELIEVEVSESIRRSHYEKISVEHLGMLFHGLFTLWREPLLDSSFDTAWSAYREVNQAVAEAIAHTPVDQPVVVHDYHLLLVPGMLRALPNGARRKIVYFHHVPWCGADSFGILPILQRTEILESLVQADSVGFHSRVWADAYRACAVRLSGALACRSVVVAPAAVDISQLLVGVDSVEVAKHHEHLSSLAAGRWTLVRVDRADLWKNALRGFLAYAELFEAFPNLVNKIWFYAVLSPTREWLPEYRDYLEECKHVVDGINARFGTVKHPRPVELWLTRPGDPASRARAAAALQVADGVLINSLFDGLNIVGKEALLLSDRSPALIVSENSGLYDELGDATIRVNPFSVSDTARAILAAVRLAPDERRAMAMRALQRFKYRNPSHWLSDLLERRDEGYSSA